MWAVGSLQRRSRESLLRERCGCLHSIDPRQPIPRAPVGLPVLLLAPQADSSLLHATISLFDSTMRKAPDVHLLDKQTAQYPILHVWIATIARMENRSWMSPDLPPLLSSATLQSLVCSSWLLMWPHSPPSAWSSRQGSGGWSGRSGWDAGGPSRWHQVTSSRAEVVRRRTLFIEERDTNLPGRRMVFGALGVNLCVRHEPHGRCPCRSFYDGNGEDSRRLVTVTGWDELGIFNHCEKQLQQVPTTLFFQDLS